MRRLKLTNFAAILAGAAIMGFGINYFNIANNLAEGGVTGIAVLLKLSFDWDPGLTSLLINIPLLLLGWKVLGRTTLIYTVFGTVNVSVFLWLFGRFRLPLDDLLLASLFAGAFVGIGLGIIFRFGGTTGGVDIIARIGHTYFGWPIGRTILVADILVIAASLIHLTVQQAMYTVVAVFIGARVIDVVQEAAYAARAVFIVSDREPEIAKKIMAHMNRGVTVLKGSGGYTDREKAVIYTVVGRFEIVKLKNLVRCIDPAAFISIQQANEVMGEGFTLDRDKQPLFEA
jgi:uncharacterized membrane-anchored protein YitT (DUF2179 family)